MPFRQALQIFPSVPMRMMLPPSRAVPPLPGGQGGAVSRVACSLPGVASDVLEWTILVVVWILVIAAAALLLRTVCLEDLDEEDDASDEDVSGHAPS